MLLGSTPALSCRESLSIIIKVMWAQEHLLLLQSLHEQFSHKKKQFLQLAQLRKQERGRGGRDEGLLWDIKR